MRNFKIDRFFCKCGCGSHGMHTRFLDMLDDARDLAGIPFVVTSGFRCKAHNSAVGGSKTSSHLCGLAADIRTLDDTARWAIVDALIKVGFTRIGVYKNFVHVDLDHNKKQEVMWFGA